MVLGSTVYPELIFHRSLIPRVPTRQLLTARLDDFGGWCDGHRPLLLDHFAVSPGGADRVVDPEMATQLTG